MRLLPLVLLLLPLAADEVAPGISYREFRVQREDGPVSMQILEVDRAAKLRPVRARDRVTGRETTTSMARRHGAIAAVNGGFFMMTGPYAGASAGVYQWNGELVADGGKRDSLVFCTANQSLEFAAFDFHGRVSTSASRYKLSGIHRAPGSDELIVFTPRFGASTLTPAGTAEVVLDASSRVVAWHEEGNALIPAGGKVLAASGKAAAWMRKHAKPGNRIRVDYNLTRRSRGCDAKDILGAGPRLVASGKRAIKVDKKAVRHPRTAIAVTHRGTVLLLTVDGRQAASIGMRLDELADELIALGAENAVNLDGGGSTTMVLNGKIMNSPSGGEERAVSDAILVFK